MILMRHQFVRISLQMLLIYLDFMALPKINLLTLSMDYKYIIPLTLFDM